MSSASRNVALRTLGCARNEVDSEELAGRLAAGGWTLTDDADAADVVVVNTCGFIESAKKDSIDELFLHMDGARKVVAVGCLAERYGDQLAESLTEADAVLGFDSYADIAARLDDVAAGRAVAAHTPRDRRTLLPVTPAQRPAAAPEVAIPGHEWLPGARSRLDDSPVAYVKLASGCDRRCTFCAIPSFRGSFVSRKPADVLAETVWLASTGVREIVLVSENSTSYGKDLGDLRALETLLPDLGAVDGIERVRVSYLQPAELRPDLLATIAATPGVAPYFDLSFQHASTPVLRRMKRFGGTAAFLDLLRRARDITPDLGARSNVIVGFPGETEDDVAELEAFLNEAELDAIGVFGYSDEEGTEAAGFADKIDPDVVAERKERIQSLADELVGQRAEDRVGTRVEVLVEQVDEDGVVGRAAHQGPEVDGHVALVGATAPRRGQLVPAFVVDSAGVDLVAEPAGGAVVTRRDPSLGEVSLGQRADAAREAARAAAQKQLPFTDDPAGHPPSPASAWNIANGLTVFRLLLVPVFVWALFVDSGHDTTWRLVAAAVFAIACVTDTVDGDIARKRGLVTEFGKLADPIADKALVGAALIGLSVLHELPWWVTVVVLVREVGVTVLRFWVIRHGVIPASRGGKIKTLLQNVAIGLFVLPSWTFLHVIAWVVMIAAVIVAVATGIDYVVRAVRLRRESSLPVAR